MIIQNSEHWSTRNELSYINALADGSWRKWCDDPPDISDEELLSNFLRGAEARKRHKTYGTVDADQVIKAARGYLDGVKG